MIGIRSTTHSWKCIARTSNHTKGVVIISASQPCFLTETSCKTFFWDFVWTIPPSKNEVVLFTWNFGLCGRLVCFLNWKRWRFKCVVHRGIKAWSIVSFMLLSLFPNKHPASACQKRKKTILKTAVNCLRGGVILSMSPAQVLWVRFIAHISTSLTWPSIWIKRALTKNESLCARSLC